MKSNSIRDKLQNVLYINTNNMYIQILTEYEPPLSSSSIHFQHSPHHSQLTRSNSNIIISNNNNNNLDISYGRIIRTSSNDYRVKRSVSTFECFMNNKNKMKKKIGMISDDCFKLNTACNNYNNSYSNNNNNQKSVSYINSQPKFYNNIVKNTNIKTEIAIVSPTWYRNPPKKKYFIADKLRKQVPYGNDYNKERNRFSLTENKRDEIRKKDHQHLMEFASGFKVGLPISLVSFYK